MELLSLLAALISLFALNWLCCVQGIAERPQINASDVVFMYGPRDVAQYDAYAGTVVGWGGRPPSFEPKDVEGFRKRVAEAHQRKMRYCASVDFVVDFGGFIDFRPESFMEAVCRDLNGKPILVPWLWDHKHKGHPAYWFCTNNPDYQAYLQDQVKRACLAPIDGLHIDDYRGTSACSAWNGGCFCSYCKDGFRGYLRRRFTREQLNEMGIEDIDKFDYQVFLKTKGITAEQFRKERGNCLLANLFQEFQTEQMKQIVSQIFEQAEKLQGKPLLRSVNSSASSPEALLIAPLIDYFCGEMNHSASSAQVPLEPAFVYRLVEALGQRQTATASGQDWAWIKANEKPGLVRTWIAQAYAFGSAFMVPYNQWCYTQELGTHWWQGKPEDFAFVYRFIRQHKSLLDGYISFANTAILYTDANFAEVRSAALEMLKANIPFAILVAEPQLSKSLTLKAVAPYDYLIIGSRPLPQEQGQVLKKTTGYLVLWKGVAELPERLKNQVMASGSEKVCISLRHKPKDSKAPLVCHLLNPNYNMEKDEVVPVDIRITLSRSLVDKFKTSAALREVVIHTPEKESIRQQIEKTASAISFEVKQLGLWAITELR